MSESSGSERARRALVVEDDADIAALVAMYLTEAGFQVLSAGNGVDGLEAFVRERPDIIILDVMLPGMDGYEVCRRVRQIANTPVIMLTARRMEEDRVGGLDLGADDYVTKPFSPRELVSRVRAVLRRATPGAEPALPARPSQLTLGELTVLLDARRVELYGQLIELTPKEFDVLVTLASAPDHVFSREDLLSRVWGFDYLGDSRTVDVHIGTLRKKIEREPGQPYRIRTVWGQGYMLETERASAGGTPC
jgi:DNA-binding response OmpR family regulator